MCSHDLVADGGDVAQRLGGDREPVADPAAVDDHVVGAAHGDVSGDERDHPPAPMPARARARVAVDTPPCRAAAVGVLAATAPVTIARAIGARLRWQTATASASAAWSGVGTSASASRRATHPSHLVLGGASAAANRRLDLLGGVGSMRGSRRWPAASSTTPRRLPDGERGADVGAEVQLLDGEGVGAVDVEQLADAGVDLRQPLLERDPGAGLHDPVVDRRQARARRRDDSVPGARGAGVDAENDHAATFCGPRRTPAGPRATRSLSRGPHQRNL